MDIKKLEALLLAIERGSLTAAAEEMGYTQSGLTNMMICGLIFKMGEYAVTKSALYCVDFAEMIPHCIALYILLIAQKQPSDQRKFLIDAGDGVNTAALSEAMDELKVCDPNWTFKIF